MPPRRRQVYSRRHIRDFRRFLHRLTPPRHYFTPLRFSSFSLRHFTPPIATISLQTGFFDSRVFFLFDIFSFISFSYCRCFSSTPPHFRLHVTFIRHYFLLRHLCFIFLRRFMLFDAAIFTPFRHGCQRRYATRHFAGHAIFHALLMPLFAAAIAASDAFAAAADAAILRRAPLALRDAMIFQPFHLFATRRRRRRFFAPPPPG
jgi:hypothetical protein